MLMKAPFYLCFMHIILTSAYSFVNADRKKTGKKSDRRSKRRSDGYMLFICFWMQKILYPDYGR